MSGRRGSDLVLMPGWRRIESRSCPGCFYYHNCDDGSTSIEPPPPWEKRLSKTFSGKEYYFNPQSSVSTWENPDIEDAVLEPIVDTKPAVSSSIGPQEALSRESLHALPSKNSAEQKGVKRGLDGCAYGCETKLDDCKDLSHCKARNCQGKRRMLKAGPCGLCASCCIGCSVHAWIRDGGLG